MTTSSRWRGPTTTTTLLRQRGEGPNDSSNLFPFPSLYGHGRACAGLGRTRETDSKWKKDYIRLQFHTPNRQKNSGGLRSISVTVRISFIQEAYMAINRILPPTKLAGHHPRTRLKWVKWLNPENSELSSCSGWHPGFVFYSPWPMQETLNCSSCRVRYWIFWHVLLKNSVRFWGNWCG